MPALGGPIPRTVKTKTGGRGAAGRAERSPRGGPLLGDLLRLPGGRCDDRRGKLVSPGRVLSRCCLRRRRWSPRRAALPLCSCPETRARHALVACHLRQSYRSKKVDSPARAEVNFGRVWLPNTDAEPPGGPRIHGCLTRPRGCSRRKTVCCPSLEPRARNVEAARRATRGCWGGAAPTAERPRSLARRSGGNSGPSVPAGRRPRLCLYRPPRRARGAPLAAT